MTTRSSSERLDPAVRKMIAITVAGVIAVYLDTTIVNVAIDTLGRELHGSVSTTQWVATSYLLSLGMSVPLSTWAGARFGAKQMWMFSLTVFLVGSLLAGCAWDIGSLVAFRVLQGVGGGLMFTILQTLVVQAAGGRKVGRVIAALGLPAVAVPILGPVIGGLILTNTSWRWIFFLNAPLCLIALVLAWRGLPPSAPQGNRRLDLAGMALLCPALALVLYGLSQAGSRGGFGDAWVTVPIAAGVVLLALFVAEALRTRGEPFVDLRLFRVRSFAISCGLLFLTGLSMYGGLLLLPLYYQQGQGHSALETGLLLIPQGIGSLIARGPIGGLTDKWGARPVALLGSCLAALGLLPFTQLSHDPSPILLGAGLVLVGAGLSAGLTAVTAGAYQGLQPTDIPHATSTIRIVQQVGGSFGTAVLAVLLQRRIAAHGGDGADGVMAAFGDTFLWAAGFTVLSIVFVLLLPRVRRSEPDPGTDAPSEPVAAKEQ